jgi:hypothetical protein
LNKRSERVDNQHPGASLLNRHPLHFFSAAATLWEPNTAYAIVNPSESDSAHVSLDARRTDEEEGCQTTLEIAPRHRVSKFFHELVGISCKHGGIVRIEADIPIAVGALKVYMPEFRFNGLAVE